MKYLFLHIPKSAGTSLRQGLVGCFPPHEVAECYHMGHIPTQLMQAVKANRKLIFGHVNFAHLRETGIPEGYQLLSMLRHPVQRCVSTYIHFLNDQDADRRDQVRDMGSFEGFMQSPFGQNWTCQYLAGVPNKPEEFETMEALYKEALLNFKKLAWVGVAERYLDSLVSLQHYLKIGAIPLVRTNASRDAVLKNKLENEYRAVILQQNQYDLKLWERANQRLKSQVEMVPFAEFKKWGYRLRRLWKT